MAGFRSKNFSFALGFVQDRELLRILSQIDAVSEKGVPHTELCKVKAGTGAWSTFPIAWDATLWWSRGGDDPLAVALGPDGHVLVGGSQGQWEEDVDSSKSGPRVYGHLMDLRWIGKHLYAAGMRRQVYRREGKDRWVHVDAGVLEAPDPKRMSGFHSIDGPDEDDLYAAGLHGEIWHRNKGKWREIDSPTNVVLNAVRAVRKDLVYVAGQNGILLRGHGDEWAAVKHDSTDEQIWDLEWYRDALYVAGDDKLYRLTGDDLKPVDLGIKRATVGSLHANDGVLLSVGPKHVLMTEDGVTWRDLDLKS